VNIFRRIAPPRPDGLHELTEAELVELGRSQSARVLAAIGKGDFAVLLESEGCSRVSKKSPGAGRSLGSRRQAPSNRRQTTMKTSTRLQGSHPSRTRSGKMRLRELATGRVFEHWAPDARGLVESGECEYVPADTPNTEPEA